MIEIKNLTKCYDKKCILKNINLKIMSNFVIIYNFLKTIIVHFEISNIKFVNSIPSIKYFTIIFTY